jgi:hypothetical protein
MRHPEQLGVPPTGPPFRGLTNDHSRERVGLGERDTAIARSLEQPASGSRGRGGEILRTT